jgi:biotin synthase
MKMVQMVQKLQEADESLTVSDIMPLLTAEGSLQEVLFEQARKVRRKVGQDDVVLRGVIEISNYCEKSCDYCAMRTLNKAVGRYTLAAEDIIRLSEQVKEAGINIVFLQGGQNREIDHLLEQVIPIIRNDLGLNVLLCLGERPKEIYNRFVELGVGSYILKYETSDPILYNCITHSRLEKRLQCIEWIRESGMKVGTGNIVGLPGQSLESIANDILLGIQINPDFISVSPFIPNNDTPLEEHPKGSANLTLNTIAILRIILKTPLIPSVSALETVFPAGQTAGLNAGANVITINFTPDDIRDLYRIYSAKRFVVSLGHALNSIESAGLKVRNVLFHEINVK